jgi:hypothetical protein
VAGRIRSIENIHLIGTGNSDLTPCSILPQPTTLPRAPVHAAFDRLNVGVTQAIRSAVSSGYIEKHKYSAWFSGKCKAYIKEKISFCKLYKDHIWLTVFMTKKLCDANS